MLEDYDIPEMVEGVWSDDPAAQVNAATKFRELLASRDPPPVDEIIKAGVVPRFVEFLGRNDLPELQLEAAWTLTNIACGNSEYTRVVIEHDDAVPLLVHLLSSSNADIRENAVWALGNGNIAGDAPSSRDLVLNHGALLPLLSMLDPYSRLSMLRTTTWVLCNFCRGNLSYLTADAPNEKIQAVIEAGVCPRLIHLLHSDASALVIEPALRTLGNIVTGDDAQTQLVIDNQVLPCLHQLLTQNHKESIKAVACWTVSNITGGTEDQVQAVIDANIIPPLLDLLQNAELNIKKEAVWAISNAIYRGSIEQIKFLASHGCTEALCDLLSCSDPMIVSLCKEGLEHILMVAEVDKKIG